jgi:hypothetical protein
MGIGPITNLMTLPVARSIQGDLDPLPMERVESSAKTGDETYSPSGGKSARGSEDDASDDTLQESLEDTLDDAPASSTEVLETGQISFFA